MSIPQIIGKNVLIIGCPASGKTYLANYLKKSHGKTHKFFHTDDYMAYGYKESLYVLMNDLMKVRQPTIIEGIQGYRLLRKGVELDSYFPDIVIELKISEATMLRTYRTERQGKKIESLLGFNKTHDKILSDYFAMTNYKKPEWIKLENEY